MLLLHERKEQGRIYKEEQNGEVLGQKQAELELKELNGSCSSLISSRGQIDVKERCRDQKMKKGQN